MPAPTTTSGAVGVLAGATLAALTLAGGDFECPDDYRCTPKAAFTQAVANPAVSDIEGACVRNSPQGMESCIVRNVAGSAVDLSCKDSAYVTAALSVCGDGCGRNAEWVKRAAVLAAQSPLCQPDIGPPPDPIPVE